MNPDNVYYNLNTGHFGDLLYTYTYKYIIQAVV